MGKGFWSGGGYAAAAGEGVDAEIIREYIKKQGRKGEQLKLFGFSWWWRDDALCSWHRVVHSVIFFFHFFTCCGLFKYLIAL